MHLREIRATDITVAIYPKRFSGSLVFIHFLKGKQAGRKRQVSVRPMVAFL